MPSVSAAIAGVMLLKSRRWSAAVAASKRGIVIQPLSSRPAPIAAMGRLIAKSSCTFFRLRFCWRLCNSIRRAHCCDVVKDQSVKPNGDDINDDQNWDNDPPFIGKFIGNLPHPIDRQVSSDQRENKAPDGGWIQRTNALEQQTVSHQCSMIGLVMGDDVKTFLDREGYPLDQH